MFSSSQLIKKIKENQVQCLPKTPIKGSYSKALILSIDIKSKIGWWNL